MVVPDAALAAVAATNSTAFAAVYRRYGPDLHGFCVGMLRDPDAAADCVHDVFVIAATRLSQLREHDKLRSWLYAIARREALRRLKHRRREEPADQLPDSPDTGSADGTGDVGHDLARREVVDLVDAAFHGLPDQDRAIFELHYRRGLNGPALADALGLSATNANTRVGRMRATVEKSLGALLVARHHRDRCPELAGVLEGWDGTLTVLMRKRIAGHIERCASCSRARSELVDPRALLASAPAAIPLPDWLGERILAEAAPLVDAAAPPAGAAVAVGQVGVGPPGASWWPAGMGLSTKTVVAVAAPFAAAAVAVPLVALALARSTPPAEPVAAAAPVLSAPLPTTSSRGSFALDTSTTRYARPSTEDSTGTTEPPRSSSTVPTTLGGAARPAPGGAGVAPTPSAQRRNGIGLPVVPPKTTEPPVSPPPVTVVPNLPPDTDGPDDGPTVPPIFGPEN